MTRIVSLCAELLRLVGVQERRCVFVVYTIGQPAYLVGARYVRRTFTPLKRGRNIALEQ